MGAYSPVPFLSESELALIGKQILDPWQRGCAAEGIDFRGILYPGLMLTRTGPKVLEFNARFGDPETQVYLPRLQNDLVEVLTASAEGKLGPSALNWSNQAVVCVVMASGGYPGNYQKGKPIAGLDEAGRGAWAGAVCAAGVSRWPLFQAGLLPAGSIKRSNSRVLFFGSDDAVSACCDRHIGFDFRLL